MALQGNDDVKSPTAIGNAFTSATARPSAARTEQAAPTARVSPTPQRGATFNFREVGRLVNAPMGRTPASEVLTKLHKALTEIYKNANNQFEIALIPVDMANESALNISSLVVAGREVGGNGVVGYHTLILEGSVEAIAPKYEQINGNNVEITRVAGDANDMRFADVIRDHVQRQFPNSDLLNASACVVPRDFNIDDAMLAYKLGANAIFAVATEIETHREGFIDMNLANASNDDALTVRTAFPGTQEVDAVGQPFRADITIDLQATARDQNQQQQIDRVTQVSRVAGFMDLVWHPEYPPQTGFSGFGVNPWQQNNQNQMNRYQRYMARFVMTNMQMTAASTLPMQLLALVTAVSLRENNGWAQAFAPAPFSGAEVDLRDIGAVGIEANFEENASGYGSRIDTKADNFKPEFLAKLIQQVIRPGLILSLDTPECGADTWYNGIFAAAAENDAQAKIANDEILDAAHYLTNGAFTNHFKGGRVAVDENNRIHLGTYVDRQNVVRDLRDVDYLAVLNMLGENSPELVREWSDTFARGDSPLAPRLAARKRIISGLFSSVKFTGFARRVTFEANFIDALVQGCQDCGLDIRSVSPYTDVGMYQRATANLGGSVLQAGQTTGLFNRGTSGASGAGMGTRNRIDPGRWR